MFNPTASPKRAETPSAYPEALPAGSPANRLPESLDTSPLKPAQHELDLPAGPPAALPAAAEQFLGETLPSNDRQHSTGKVIEGRGPQPPWDLQHNKEQGLMQTDAMELEVSADVQEGGKSLEPRASPPGQESTSGPPWAPQNQGQPVAQALDKAREGGQQRQTLHESGRSIGEAARCLAKSPLVETQEQLARQEPAISSGAVLYADGTFQNCELSARLTLFHFTFQQFQVGNHVKSSNDWSG